MMICGRMTIWPTLTFMDNYKYSIGFSGKIHKFSSSNKESLIADVIRFHQENNINFSVVEIGRAIDRQSKIKTAVKKLSLADAINGAKAVLKYTTGKSESPSEIDRRSLICNACPLKQMISGCRSCGAAGAIAKFVNAVRVSMKVQAAIPSEIREQYCGHCGCALALLVVTKLEDFREEDPSTNTKRPDMCWLKTTSTSYKK